MLEHRQATDGRRSGGSLPHFAPYHCEPQGGSFCEFSGRGLTSLSKFRAKARRLDASIVIAAVALGRGCCAYTGLRTTFSFTRS